MSLGATGVPIARVFSVLLNGLTGRLPPGGDALIILQVRLPRLLLGLLVGAALASSGTLMQGLFRNPLADPGLVGVSTGAALAAAATITFGLYLIATRHGRTSIATMLLATPFLGRGLNALSLGEAEAFHLSIPMQRVKAAAILLVAIAIGASVACAGMIGKGPDSPGRAA